MGEVICPVTTSWNAARNFCDGRRLGCDDLFDRVLGGLSTVIDHVEFGSRSFITRQLVHALVAADPFDVVRASSVRS